MPARKLPKCEHCNSRMVARGDHLWCQVCGCVRRDAAALDALRAFAKAGGRDTYAAEFSPNQDRHSISVEQEQMLDEAWRALKKGDPKTARFLAYKVADRNHRVIEAYYILYLTTPKTNSLEKARHLASILALEPQHNRARQEMEKLKKIVGANVKPSFTTVFDHRQYVEEDVQAKGELEVCPMCGGKTLYVEEDFTKCLSCDYTPNLNTQAATPSPAVLSPDGNFHSLQEALWQRKYGGQREWIIARRVLACQNCGAQLTLSGNMMVDQCAFCDSQHILVRDALGSFREPDAILPAKLDEREAILAKMQQLPALVQQQVYRHESVGLFLPYWNYKRVGAKLTSNRGTILVPATKEPSVKVLEDIQPFYLDDLRPYDQRFLASWSAQLYAFDMIQGSLYVDANDPGALEYRLLLLPVWMTTFHLRGGGYYHSLINAQTGEVVTHARLDSQTDYQTRRERIMQANTPPAIRPLKARPSSVIKPLPPRSLD